MRHAHSGARVVGRDVGCGWVGVGSEWILIFFLSLRTWINESDYLCFMYLSVFSFFFFFFLYSSNKISIPFSLDLVSFSARLFVLFLHFFRL